MYKNSNPNKETIYEGKITFLQQSPWVCSPHCRAALPALPRGSWPAQCGFGVVLQSFVSLFYVGALISHWSLFILVSIFAVLLGDCVCFLFLLFVCLFQKERKKNIELGVPGGEVDLEAVGEGENMIKICFVKKETLYIKKPISKKYNSMMKCLSGIYYSQY